MEFPAVLDLAPYCSELCHSVTSGQTKLLYSLYGIVEHSGRLTGGHYTAYVKVRADHLFSRRYWLVIASLHVLSGAVILIGVVLDYLTGRYF